METPQVSTRANRRVTPVLALLSLLVPLGTQFIVARAPALGTAPSAPPDYRATTSVLVLAMIAAGATLGSSRLLTPAWLRWWCWIAASVGALLSGFLVWSLIGLCGLQVLWATCTP